MFGQTSRFKDVLVRVAPTVIQQLARTPTQFVRRFARDDAILARVREHLTHFSLVFIERVASARLARRFGVTRRPRRVRDGRPARHRERNYRAGGARARPHRARARRTFDRIIESTSATFRSRRHRRRRRTSARASAAVGKTRRPNASRVLRIPGVEKPFLTARHTNATARARARSRERAWGGMVARAGWAWRRDRVMDCG